MLFVGAVLQLATLALGACRQLPMVWPKRPLAQVMPSVGVRLKRIAGFATPEAHLASHDGNAATRVGLGMVYTVPAGVAPMNGISVARVTGLSTPLPVLHSPKAMVLVVPSVISRTP